LIKFLKLDSFIFIFFLLIILNRQLPLHSETNIILVILLVVFSINSKTKFSLPKKLIYVSVPYLFVVLISTIFSQVPNAGMVQFLRELFFFIVLAILYNVIDSKSTIKKIFKAITISGIIASFFIILQFIFLKDHFDEIGQIKRVSGIFENESAAALVIGFSFIIVLFEENSFLYKFITLIILFSAIIFTGSRSSLIFILIALLYYFKKYILALTFILIILILLIIAYVGLDNAFLILRIENGLSGRDYLFNRAVELFSNHSIIGTGPSSFRFYALTNGNYYLDSNQVDILLKQFEKSPLLFQHEEGFFGGFIGNSSHNIWLDQAIASGIFGILSLAYIFIYVFRLLINHFQYLKKINSDFSLYVLIILVSWFAFFIKSNVEPPGLLRGSLSEAIILWTFFIITIKIKIIENRLQTK